MKYYTWVYQRPYYSPAGGFVSATSANHAIDLVNHAFGYVGGTKVTTALKQQGQTESTWYDENGVIE